MKSSSNRKNVISFTIGVSVISDGANAVALRGYIGLVYALFGKGTRFQVVYCYVMKAKEQNFSVGSNFMRKE